MLDDAHRKRTEGTDVLAALIDIPPDELVDRLKQGKVYPQDQAAR